MKTGVLLINLGTPQSASVKDVRHYLKEFLSDPRVIDIPAFARWILVNLIILPLRPKRSSKAYQKIWQPAGSPLLIYSQQLADKVAAELSTNYQVALGMRYGKPSIAAALQQLQSCERLIVVPLFPQYASASSGSAIAKTLQLIQQRQTIPSINIIHDFYQQPDFIHAYADNIRPTIADCEHIIFSYHGLPERQIQKADCRHQQNCQATACPAIDEHNRFCYRAQCYATSRAIAEHLHLPKEKYSVAFQSRLGRTPWIKPYTDLLLPQLYQQGIRHLAIASPSFVADCLETLEELGIRAREQWRQLGGESFKLIPCLNDHHGMVKALCNLIR